MSALIDRNELLDVLRLRIHAGLRNGAIALRCEPSITINPADLIALEATMPAPARQEGAAQ